MKIRFLRVAPAAWCAVGFAQGFVQHPAHEHGKVTLNIALDGTELVIALESPAVNVVGFEHEPRTDEERAAVGAAEKLLRSGRGLFTLPPEAGCRLAKTELESPRWETTDEVPGGPEPPGRHADYGARFTYHCGAADNLTWLEPTLLGQLRNVAEARLNVATARGQHSEVVTNGRTRISLRSP